MGRPGRRGTTVQATSTKGRGPGSISWIHEKPGSRPRGRKKTVAGSQLSSVTARGIGVLQPTIVRGLSATGTRCRGHPPCRLEHVASRSKTRCPRPQRWITAEFPATSAPSTTRARTRCRRYSRCRSSAPREPPDRSSRARAARGRTAAVRRERDALPSANTVSVARGGHSRRRAPESRLDGL